MQYVIIGISDAPQPQLSAEAVQTVRSGRVFSGGRRHREIMKPLLPEGTQWIDITTPLDDVFRQYEAVAATAAPADFIVIFASGDPLFFGFANTLLRRWPEADVRLFNTFNSLQMLAHRLLMPYDDLRIVSLTGRPWPALDRALIERAPKIGILTDRNHTPAAIARRLLDYGYTDYDDVAVGEHLGNPERERISRLSLSETASAQFDHPNCLILSARNVQRAPFGLPDAEFATLEGRPGMMTKMPIRLLSLQAMELPRRSVLWDVGFCTGSVSIEARLQFPHLTIEAFEIRPEGSTLMATNTRRFGAPGIGIHIGDFFETDVRQLPRPDAVFIGGHGGRLAAMMERISRVLLPGGCIVMNAVSSESRSTFLAACQPLGLVLQPEMRIAIDSYNPIYILKCVKPQQILA